MVYKSNENVMIKSDIELLSQKYKLSSWTLFHTYESIWPTLVSKQLSGPQQSHPLIEFWLNDC